MLHNVFVYVAQTFWFFYTHSFVYIHETNAFCVEFQYYNAMEMYKISSNMYDILKNMDKFVYQILQKSVFRPNI